MSSLNLYGLYKTEFTWQAVELAVASSIGIFFAIGWGDFIGGDQLRDIGLIERVFVAFTVTFIAAVVMKSIVDWFRRHKTDFDIV